MHCSFDEFLAMSLVERRTVLRETEDLIAEANAETEAAAPSAD